MNEADKPMTDGSTIEHTIRSLLGARDPTASICPSEVARQLSKSERGWRALMPAVREVAANLARRGELRITRGDAEVAPDDMSGGPIRLRRGPTWR